MTAEWWSRLIISFLAYGFLGWILEGVVMLIEKHRLINRGFLTGPVLPIYGFGAVAILLLTAPVRSQPWLVFVVGVVAASVIEFIGHLGLEKLLGLVLWDYTGRFANIQGRVCLTNALGFGVAGLFVVYVADPWLSRFIDGLGLLTSLSVASVLATLVVVDFVHAVVAVVRVRPEVESAVESLAALQARLESRLDELAATLDEQVADGRERLAESRERLAEGRDRLLEHADQTRDRLQEARAALPSLPSPTTTLRHQRVLRRSRGTLGRLDQAFPRGRMQRRGPGREVDQHGADQRGADGRGTDARSADGH